MDTPATDRAIAWIRTMRTLGDDSARIAEEFAGMPPARKTAAVFAFLRELERFTFGPDQSKLGREAAERLGEAAWDELRRSVHAVRNAVAQEMHATLRPADDT